MKREAGILPHLRLCETKTKAREGGELLTNNVITPSQKAVIIAGFLNNQAGELNHNE